MLIACIVVKMLVTATIANRVKTIYKLSSGETLNDIMKYLAKEISNSESVGLRINSANKNIELLTYNWMESRNYVEGYSYYEKILVDEEFDDDKVGGHIDVKIQGPLESHSKLFVSCLAPNPFARFTFDVVDQKYHSEGSPSQIRFHISFREGWLIYNWLKDGEWQTETVYQTNDFNLHEVITITIEVKPDHFHGNVLGGYPGDVYQVAPGDMAAFIRVGRTEDQPKLQRFVYEKGE